MQMTTYVTRKVSRMFPLEMCSLRNLGVAYPTRVSLRMGLERLEKLGVAGIQFFLERALSASFNTDSEVDDSDFVLSIYSCALFWASVNSLSNCSIPLPTFFRLDQSPRREYSSERFSIIRKAASNTKSRFSHPFCTSLRLGG